MEGEMGLLSPIFFPLYRRTGFWQCATLKEQTAAPSLSLNANFYSLLVLLFFWLLPVFGGAHPPLSPPQARRASFSSSAIPVMFTLNFTLEFILLLRWQQHRPLEEEGSWN